MIGFGADDSWIPPVTGFLRPKGLVTLLDLMAVVLFPVNGFAATLAFKLPKGLATVLGVAAAGGFCANGPLRHAPPPYPYEVTPKPKSGFVLIIATLG